MPDADPEAFQCLLDYIVSDKVPFGGPAAGGAAKVFEEVL